MSLDTCFPVLFSGLPYLTATVYFKAQSPRCGWGEPLWGGFCIFWHVYLYLSLDVCICVERPRCSHIQTHPHLGLFYISIYPKCGGHASIFTAIQHHKFHPKRGFPVFVSLVSRSEEPIYIHTCCCLVGFLRAAVLHHRCDLRPCVHALLHRPGSEPGSRVAASSVLGPGHAACLVRPQLTALGLTCSGAEREEEAEEEEGQRDFRADCYLPTLCKNHLRSLIFVLQIVFPSMSGCYWWVAKSHLTLCDLMDCSMLGSSVLHWLPVCSDSCPLSQWCYLTF